jgi:hypothetical protein
MFFFLRKFIDHIAEVGFEASPINGAGTVHGLIASKMHRGIVQWALGEVSPLLGSRQRKGPFSKKKRIGVFSLILRVTN